MTYNKILTFAGILLFFTTSCSSDFLNVVPTENASEDQMSEVLAKDAEKIKAFITGFYNNLYSPVSRASHDDFGLKAIELATDLMGADMAYATTHFFAYDYDWDNRQSSYRRATQTWQQLYAAISGANTVISNLKMAYEDNELTETVEKMLGESYTVRAYCYFWLINMFQQPYEWNKTALGIPIYNETETRLERCPVSDVYAQILADIELGYNYLKGKGISSRSTLNEYAAAAIYAIILQFVNDYPEQWKTVASYAEEAIKGGTLMSESDLLSGFNSINLSEVLWGAAINAETTTFYASFMSHMDPNGPGYGGKLGNYKQIASDLYEKIPDNDIRKNWFTIDKNGVYLQNKFVDVGSLGIGDAFTSDYIYLRTGEMYLVAAEAYYMNGEEGKAKAKLQELLDNRIPGYTVTSSGDALLEEIKLQKRIEMWGEGRRLLDMKRRAEPLDRTGATNHKATTIMKADANDYRMIYQIPDKEMDANAEITEQNK